MKLETNYQPLFDHATTTFYAAAEDVLELARKTAPRSSGYPRTSKYARQAKRGKRKVPGPYADSLRMKRRQRGLRPTATIGSPLPYAGALERGAWTRGPGRGPRISRLTSPGTLAAAGDHFDAFFRRRARQIPIGRTSVYMDHGVRERGPSELNLGLR